MTRPGAVLPTLTQADTAPALPHANPPLHETDHLHVLRLRFMFDRALTYTPAVWVIAFFIGLALYRHASDAWALLWPVAIALGYQARDAWLRPALAAGVIERGHGIWQRRMFRGTVAVALLVAIGPWSVFPLLPEGVQMYITLILCFWLSGSMASIGHDPKLYTIYATIFCTGICLGWLRVNSPYAVDVLIMLPIYVLVVAGFSRGVASVVNESLRVRTVNEQVVAALHAAKEAAEEASRAKSRFLAVSSHDLRQPLHALTLLNGLLRRAQPSERVQEIAQQMGRSLATLERLFSSVLDFSRLEASAIQPHPHWFHLDELIESLRDELSMHAAAKGLQLEFTRSGQDALCDPDLLERILRNLLENALKFTDAGSVRVSVYAGSSAEPRPVIEVSDTGRGIAPDQRAEVFKEYFQLPGSAPGAGLGLGLAIVERLADLLGITVTIDNHLPHGTRFRLMLPAGALRPHQPGDSAVASPESDASELGQLRILCIDDDPSSLAALGSLLHDWGCQTLAAASPDDAFALARAHPDIDVVLSDYALGHALDGAALIHALRELLGEVPGALLTGDPAAAQAHKDGTIEFPVLVKPVQPADLRALLEVFVSVG